MFSLSFWQSLPAPSPTAPITHKHIYFLSGLCMISKFEIVSDAIKSLKFHLETKAAGGEMAKVTEPSMSVRAGTETLPS